MFLCFSAIGLDPLLNEAEIPANTTGQIAPEHWFKLGRSLTPTGTERALLSWSASMFEYFMPLLVMRAYPGTLLDETYRGVISRQMHYASTRKVLEALGCDAIQGYHVARPLPPDALLAWLRGREVPASLRKHPFGVLTAGRDPLRSPIREHPVDVGATLVPPH